MDVHLLGEESDQFRMPVGHESRQKSDPAACAGGLDVSKDVGGHEGCGRSGQMPFKIEVADLKQRVVGGEI